MARATKPTSTITHPRPSSFLSLLTGWMQQGVESFFATQRILVDVAMRQNTIAMKSLQEALTDPKHSPAAILTELAVEGTSSFIEAQKILLNLAQQENEIIMMGIKERVAGSAPASATADLLRRSIDTYIGMQHEFLKTTSKRTLTWLDGVRAGKGYSPTQLLDMAREGIGTFVTAQKKFLDVVAQEATKATGGKADHITKKTELSKLAREATNAFIEAQKKLLDVVSQQMNVNLSAATHTLEMFSPTRLMPMANVTGEGVKSFVNAEKAMIQSMIKGNGVKPKEMPERRPKRRARPRKMAKARSAQAGA